MNASTQFPLTVELSDIDFLHRALEIQLGTPTRSLRIACEKAHKKYPGWTVEQFLITVEENLIKQAKASQVDPAMIEQIHKKWVNHVLFLAAAIFDLQLLEDYADSKESNNPVTLLYMICMHFCGLEFSPSFPIRRLRSEMRKLLRKSQTRDYFTLLSDLRESAKVLDPDSSIIQPTEWPHMEALCVGFIGGAAALDDWREGKTQVHTPSLSIVSGRDNNPPEYVETIGA